MILEKLKTTNLNSSFLINNYSDDSLLKIISSCKDSCNTLKDLVEMFDIMLNTLILNDEAISSAKKTYSSQLQLFIDELTKNLKTNLPELIEKHKVSKKDAFTFLRLACTGKQHGLTINQIFDLLSPEEINKRINQLLTSII
jgi:glutamyl/glutaminyl-tRNA synthetase